MKTVENMRWGCGRAQHAPTYWGVDFVGETCGRPNVFSLQIRELRLEIGYLSIK